MLSEPAVNIAYLAQGRLRVSDGAKPGRLIESAFAQGVADRAAAAQERAGWKTGGTPSGFMPRNALWNVEQRDARRMQIRFAGVAPGAGPDELFYTLETDTVGGWFRQALPTQEEQRLFHREGMRLRDPARHPAEPVFAASRPLPNGTAAIVTISGPNADVSEVTGGDAVDEAPAWLPDGSRRLVYASAGLARNEQGFCVGLGPYSIQQLDLDSSELATRLEDARSDLLQPKALAGGDLLFIRRPYEPGGRRPVSHLAALRDVLLLPFRLLRALLHFLDFFSRTFSQKPLTAVGGPKADGADERTLVLRGRVLDAAKMSGDPADAAAGLVPANWELVRRDAAGAERVLARGVASFDVAADGTLVYTNGRAVYRLPAAGGAPELLFKDRLVEQLVVWG